MANEDPREDAKEKIRLFKEEYNGFRPHSSLSGLTPKRGGPTTLSWSNFFYFRPVAKLGGAHCSSRLIRRQG
jgi:hypothetical protein